MYFKFLDNDSFHLYTLDIPVTYFTSIVDDNGNIVGYGVNSKVSMDINTYNQFSSCTMSYNL